MPGPMGRRNRGPAQKVENSGQVLKRLFGIIFKKYKFQMIIVFVCILISVLANVQGSLFIQNLIDDYITPMIQSGSRDFGPMLGAILRVAIFYAIGAASAFIYAKIMVYVTQGTMRDLRCQIFEHMESLPIKYFDTHPHGDIMSVYTNDIDTLRQMISQSIPQLFNSGITIIAVLVSMFTLSIPLTILTLVMVGVMLFVTKQLASRSGRFFAKQQADLGATNGYIEEMMNGQKVVKVFCHEEESKKDFPRLNDALFHSADQANTFANILGPINAQLGNILVRHNGRGVGVYQNDLHALFLQGTAGLCARIIELCCLADDNRTGTNHKYLLNIWILRHYLFPSIIFMKRSNRYAESRGPGHASGWNCTVYIFLPM